MRKKKNTSGNSSEKVFTLRMDIRTYHYIILHFTLFSTPISYLSPRIPATETTTAERTSISAAKIDVGSMVVVSAAGIRRLKLYERSRLS